MAASGDANQVMYLPFTSGTTVEPTSAHASAETDIQPHLAVGDVAAGQAAVPHWREEPASYRPTATARRHGPLRGPTGRQIRRVIAGVDCGFGTFVGWEWVTEDVVWAKLATLRAGADVASKRLWNRKVA